MKARLALLLMLVAFAAACGDGAGDPGGEASPGATGAADGGTTIGKIDRFPGGTAVITSDHTLVSITCANEQLIMTTSAGVFSGAMPCDRMVTQDIIDRFTGKPIAITITAQRLKIENPEAGSLDFPATGVRQ